MLGLDWNVESALENVLRKEECLEPILTETAEAQHRRRNRREKK
jgi:hypothetical protein